MCPGITEKKIAKELQQDHERLAQIIVPGRGDWMCKMFFFHIPHSFLLLTLIDI